MILVLFLCLIIILIMLAIIFTILSSINIKIKDFELANIKHIEPNYEVVISFELLNKIKWLSIRLNNKKMRKMYKKMHLERIDIKKIEKDLKFSDIQEILKIKPKISQLNLKIKLGVDDVIITSYLVPIICSIFSIILPNVTEKKNIKNVKYKIEPLYNNQNVYHIKLDTTIEMKMINIFNCVLKIYKSKKKQMENDKINQVATTHS